MMIDCPTVTSEEWDRQHRARIAGHMVRVRGVKGRRRPRAFSPTEARRSRPVMCLDNGFLFRSIREAADWLGVNWGTMQAAVHRTGVCWGLRWKFLKNKHCRVRCVETGQIYQSAMHASEALGLARRTVSTMIAKRRTMRGMHFEWVDELCGN